MSKINQTDRHRGKVAQHAGEVADLKQAVMHANLHADAAIADMRAAFKERDQLRAQLAEAKEAARTWENKAERRSRRYEQCAAQLAEYKVEGGKLSPAERAPSPFADKFDGLAGRGMHELRSDELTDYLAHVAISHGPLTDEFKAAAGWLVSELERKTNDERVLAVKLDRMRESMQSPASAGMVVVPDPLIQSQTRRQVTDVVEAHANGVVEGWNGCRAAMLASMQQSAGSDGGPAGTGRVCADYQDTSRES